MTDTALTDPAMTESAAQSVAERIRAAAARVAAAGESARRPGPYPVNQPMIDHWVTALDSYRPADEGISDQALDTAETFAPPAMIQVWTMAGLRGQRAADDPLGAMMGVLDQAGYTSVVATNCEQTYHRYLNEGERVSVSARLAGVTGPKRTALGEGWFVTTHSTWFVDDEPVAEMIFRVLKFRPPQPSPVVSPADVEPVVAKPVDAKPVDAKPADAKPADAKPVDANQLGAPQVDAKPVSAQPVGAGSTSSAGSLRPVVSRDTEFFWAGTAVRELRVQRCEDCGAVRHPPGPRCTACGSPRRGYLLARGTGTIYSYVVHHHPPVSGRTVPFVVALIELPEGVRMLGELVGVDPLDPSAAAAIQIGSAVRVSWQPVDDELTLPSWRIEAGG